MLDSYVCNEYVKRISLEEDVIHVTSYLCSWNNVDEVEVLPAKTVCDDKAVWYSRGGLGKMHLSLQR